MKERIIQFIRENELSPFAEVGIIKKKENAINIFKTSDAKKIHLKTIDKITGHFQFQTTKNILNIFDFTEDIAKIRKRQEFFKTIKIMQEKTFLKKIEFPKKNWKPKYTIIVATEDEKTYNELKNRKIPMTLLLSPNDVNKLQDYDIVQVLNCYEYSRSLESLQNTVFLNSIDEAYLERNLELLSEWKHNLVVLAGHFEIGELKEMLTLIDATLMEKIDERVVQEKLKQVNHNISEKIKQIKIEGESLFNALSKDLLPREVMQIINEEISDVQLPSNLFTRTIPVKIDNDVMQELMQKQETNENTDFAEKIKKNSLQLKQIPKKLQELTEELVYFDFVSGISQITPELEYPEFSEELLIHDSKNMFLKDPQAISFRLDDKERCSILTGANSGGKTTLVEHVIQIISCYQLGLPVSGKTKMPHFTEIYYFAKNKGAATKGAFETLLTQMSKIKTGKRTLILADEIEAVTEPGVAAGIISTTADYFTQKGCYLIIATHLGQEIAKNMPNYSRVDGIEAKGLDEHSELIVDHNPVLGRIANSTPELIVRKMAQQSDNEYLKYVNMKLIKE